MIFPKPSGASEVISTGREPLGYSFAFDYDSKRFKIVDGSPVLISGTAAIAQWIELLARTVPQKFDAYSAQFGVSTDRLIGQKHIPRGAIISEIQREIEEGAALCPAIRSVSDFSLVGNTIEFTVTQIDGEESEESIEL